MRRIVIVGGGYAGFYTALGLEKKLARSDDAEVILIDPRPYMTYQPFLPEVLAGSLEPRHGARLQSSSAPYALIFATLAGGAN